MYLYFIIFDERMKKTLYLLIMLPLMAFACKEKEKQKDPILGFWLCNQSDLAIENNRKPVAKNDSAMLRWEFLHSIIYNTDEFIDHHHSDTEMFSYTHRHDTLRINRTEAEEVYRVEKLDSLSLVVVCIHPQPGIRYYFKKVESFYLQ
jgi:hypothetical protein